jgi:hypothetical protein
MQYVYRWDRTKQPPDKKLFAVFMTDADAATFVAMMRWGMGDNSWNGCDNPQMGDYWFSPYGPTLPGNETTI